MVDCAKAAQILQWYLPWFTTHDLYMRPKLGEDVHQLVLHNDLQTHDTNCVLETARNQCTQLQRFHDSYLIAAMLLELSKLPFTLLCCVLNLCICMYVHNRPHEE